MEIELEIEEFKKRISEILSITEKRKLRKKRKKYFEIIEKKN